MLYTARASHDTWVPRRYIFRAVPPDPALAPEGHADPAQGLNRRPANALCAAASASPSRGAEAGGAAAAQNGAAPDARTAEGGAAAAVAHGAAVPAVGAKRARAAESAADGGDDLLGVLRRTIKVSVRISSRLM